MNYAIVSYGRATGVSLFIHVVLLSLVLFFGHAYLQPKLTEEAVPIEIVPASVLDTGDMRMQAESPAQQPQMQPEHANASTPIQPMARQAASHTEYQAAAAVGAAEVVLPPASGAHADEGVKAAEAAPTSAGVLSSSRPRYPASARQSGWEGTVVVRVLIDSSGSPASVSVRSSSGKEVFDDAAVQAVQRWRFSPATRGGKPVSSYYDVRVRFSLDDA